MGGILVLDRPYVQGVRCATNAAMDSYVNMHASMYVFTFMSDPYSSTCVAITAHSPLFTHAVTLSIHSVALTTI